MLMIFRRRGRNGIDCLVWTQSASIRSHAGAWSLKLMMSSCSVGQVHGGLVMKQSAALTSWRLVRASIGQIVGAG